MPVKKRPMQKDVKEAPTRRPQTEWIINRFRSRGWDKPKLTQRFGRNVYNQYGSVRGMEPPHMRLDDAAVWAEVLGITYAEVAARFGYNLPALDPVQAPVIGSVNERGEVAWTLPPQQYKVPMPPSLTPRAVAVEVLSAHTALAVMHRSLLFYEPIEGVAPDAWNRICLVELPRHGGAPLVGLLTKSTLGHVRVAPLGRYENVVEDDAAVNAFPIRWQRFA